MKTLIISTLTILLIACNGSNYKENSRLEGYLHNLLKKSESSVTHEITKTIFSSDSTIKLDFCKLYNQEFLMFGTKTQRQGDNKIDTFFNSFLPLPYCESVAETDLNYNGRMDIVLNYKQDLNQKELSYLIWLNRRSGYRLLGEDYKIDTTSIKGKIDFTLQQLDDETIEIAGFKDSLFDINFDGQKDLVVRYNGLSGTGLTNRSSIFLYDKSKNCFIEDSVIFTLSNPTFYMKDRIITEFYIGHGGGWGVEYHWENKKWLAKKSFDVWYSEDSLCQWLIYSETDKLLDSIALPYQNIPPEEVLVTKYQY